MYINRLILLMMVSVAACNGFTSENPVAIVPGGDHPLRIVAETSSLVGDDIVYSAWDTTAGVYSLRYRKKVYTQKLASICYAKPVLRGNKLWLPVSDSLFSCIDMQTGQSLWQVALKGRCSRFSWVNDSLVILSVKSEGLICLNAGNGQLLRRITYNPADCFLPDPSSWSFCYDSGNVYIANWGCFQLSAFALATGENIWNLKVNTGFYTGMPVIRDNMLFVGMDSAYKKGRVYLLDKYTGQVYFSTELPFEQRMEPRWAGTAVLFYTYDNAFRQLDVKRKEVTVIAKLSKDKLASGSPFFYENKAIWFTGADAQFYKYELSTHTLRGLQKVNYSVSDMVFHNGKPYIIN